MLYNTVLLHHINSHAPPIIKFCLVFSSLLAVKAIIIDEKKIYTDELLEKMAILSKATGLNKFYITSIMNTFFMLYSLLVGTVVGTFMGTTYGLFCGTLKLLCNRLDNIE